MSAETTLDRGLPCIGCGQLGDPAELKCLPCRTKPAPARTLEEARVVQVWTVEGTPFYNRALRDQWDWDSDAWPDPRGEAEDFIRRQRGTYDDLVLSHRSILYSTRVVVPT